MITKRIIPCLDVKDGRVVKGVNFTGLSDVNDPVELGRYYSENGADELVFYDITASSDGRQIFTDILTETAKKVFRKIDHSAIYLLIAGTYTPICLSMLGGTLGWVMFGIVYLLLCA